MLSVTEHPMVVVLCGLKKKRFRPDRAVKVAEVIRANTNKQVLAFTGDASEVDELRAFLRNPSGFLVTTPDLFSGMEATSVIVCILDRGHSGAERFLNGLSRTTTSLINIPIRYPHS